MNTVNLSKNSILPEIRRIKAFLQGNWINLVFLVTRDLLVLTMNTGNLSKNFILPEIRRINAFLQHNWILLIF